MNPLQDGILILDFGSQYTQLIARRIREQNVYSEIRPYAISLSEIQKLKPKGIIFSGGPASVLDPKAHFIDPEIYNLGMPILGICYGMQLMTHQLHGKVEKALDREYGNAEVTLVEDSLLWRGLSKENPLKAWMSHGDRILKLPSGFKIIARSKNSPAAAMCHETKPLYAVQFHPEVTHTPQGTEILKNFIFQICHVTPSWTMQSFVEHTIQSVRNRVQENKVVMGVSGGGDSTVAAMLLQKTRSEER